MSEHPTSAGPPEPPDDPVGSALDVIAALTAVLGPGKHIITCTVSVPIGIGYGQVRIQRRASGPFYGLGSPWDLVDAVDVLASALSGRDAGAIIVRSFAPDDERESVRAWAIDGTWPKPLTPAEVRTAYSTHPITGETLPPEEQVEFLPGIPLLRPEGSTTVKGERPDQ